MSAADGSDCSHDSEKQIDLFQRISDPVGLVLREVTEPAEANG